MRMGRWGLWLLTLAAVAAMTTGVNAVAAEHFETLATSASAPVKLGTGPVAVTLAPPAAGKALSARVATVGESRKVYLVAKGLGTDEPPETIYQIYLGLPPGVAPDPNGIYYVGSLNFFSAVGRSAEAGQADPRFLSFDVTALLRTLQSRNSLGDNTTVTIVPAGSPRAGAKPVIAEVALVEQ
jgi:hypothetical protein